jgi:hypothetical protein
MELYSQFVNYYYHDHNNLKMNSAMRIDAEHDAFITRQPLLAELRALKHAASVLQPVRKEAAP